MNQSKNFILNLDKNSIIDRSKKKVTELAWYKLENDVKLKQKH